MLIVTIQDASPPSAAGVFYFEPVLFVLVKTRTKRTGSK
jgi:hypothetical protein